MDVLAMRRQGMSYVEIGTVTGYHPATISKWVREGGPPPARTVAEADRRRLPRARHQTAHDEQTRGGTELPSVHTGHLPVGRTGGYDA